MKQQEHAYTAGQSSAQCTSRQTRQPPQCGLPTQWTGLDRGAPEALCSCWVLLFVARCCCAVADTGEVVLSAAVKRALSEADVAAAVGQLGANTLAPADIDVSGLDLSQGGCCVYKVGRVIRWFIMELLGFQLGGGGSWGCWDGMAAGLLRLSAVCTVRRMH